MLTIMSEIVLRDYQIKITNSLKKSLQQNDRVLVYSPTGSGKTIISKYIIDRIISNGKKVLFTVPRIKLAYQTRKSFGFGNLILGSATKDEGSLCTIASLQSLYSRKVTEYFDYIFIDECHFGGDVYIDYIFNTYKRSKIIGLSATPMDSEGYLLSGYDDIVKEVTVKDLIGYGYLTDVDVYASLVEPDLSNIPVSNGDYNMEKSSEVVREEKVLSNTIDEWARLASGKKTLVFACDINHATDLCVEFSNRGYKVDSVHSNKNQYDIDKAYQNFHLGNIEVLINVDMATFGFDEPSIECLLFARPIKSLRLYKQMIGRGLRLSKGKETCMVLDCANVVFDNGFPTDDITLTKRPLISQTIDREVGIERDRNGNTPNVINKERTDYLHKVGSLFDLYWSKEYTKEQDLVDDCKKILKRAGFYVWRQNSGKMYQSGRWVHFTDKNGLPDITLIYNGVYIGLELKLKRGRLTKHQRVTLPEFFNNGIIYFIIENMVDLFRALEKIQDNILTTNQGVIINNEIHKLSEQQRIYREKYLLLK